MAEAALTPSAKPGSEGPAPSSDPGRSPAESVLGNLARVLERRETIRFLVGSNLRAGHRDKVLGNLWNLLDPLLFLAVYFLVFGIGFRQVGSNPMIFAVYLSIGVIVHRFVDGVVSQSAVCIRLHRGLINEVAFPRAVLPISVCFSRLYDFLWALLVLGAAILLLRLQITPYVLWLPVALLIHTGLALGLGLFVAYLGAFFADTSNILSFVMRLLLFASPVVYFARSEPGHPGIVPERFLDLYALNPLAGVMDLYRDALLWGRPPETATLLYVSGVALAVLFFGFALFSRAEGQYAKYL